MSGDDINTSLQGKIHIHCRVGCHILWHTGSLSLPFACMLVQVIVVARGICARHVTIRVAGVVCVHGGVYDIVDGGL